MRYALSAAILALALTACGGEDYSDDERAEAEEFCSSPFDMAIDQYENPDGFDRCVEDVLPVLDCLGPSREALSAWIPRNCDDGGYNP